MKILYNICHTKSKGNPIFFVAQSTYDANIRIQCVITKLHRVYFQIWNRDIPMTHLIHNWTPEQFYRRLYYFRWIPLFATNIIKSPIPIKYIPTLISDEALHIEDTQIDTYYIWKHKGDTKQQIACNQIKSFLRSIPKRKHRHKLQRVHEMILFKPPTSNFMGGMKYHLAMNEFNDSLNELLIP